MSIDELYSQVKDLNAFLFRKKSMHLGVLQSLESRISFLKNELSFYSEVQETLNRIRPLLSESSLSYYQNLVTEALQTVFSKNYSFYYDKNNQEFLLELDSHLIKPANEGGGVNIIISFITYLFLLLRLGGRKVMFFDEWFTQLSDNELDRFMILLKSLKDTLGFDLLLISHDSRISEDSVDKVITL